MSGRKFATEVILEVEVLCTKVCSSEKFTTEKVGSSEKFVAGEIISKFVRESSSPRKVYDGNYFRSESLHRE